MTTTTNQDRDAITIRLCAALDNFCAEMVSTDVLLALAVMLETSQGTQRPSGLNRPNLRVV